MDWHVRSNDHNTQFIPNRDNGTATGYVGGQNKNPNLGHYAHYVPTAATTNNDRQMPTSYSGVVPKTDPTGIAARFIVEADGSVQPSYTDPPCITCQAPLNPSTWRYSETLV